MRKIFYRPHNLQIMGMSDGENSMEFPYIETDIDYHSTNNMILIRDSDNVILKIKNEIL